MQNIRELTDAELDSVGGGHLHHHHSGLTGGSFAGGGLSGVGALTALLGNLLGNNNTFINDIISIVFNFGQMNGNGTVGVNNGSSVGGLTKRI
jgi:hypothetical protein